MNNLSRISWNEAVPKELRQVLPGRCFLQHSQHGRQEYRFEYRILGFASALKRCESKFLCDADVLVRLVLHVGDSRPTLFPLDVVRFIDFVKLHSGIPLIVQSQKPGLCIADNTSYEAHTATIVSKRLKTDVLDKPDIKMTVRSWVAGRRYYSSTQTSPALCTICNKQGHRYTTCCEQEGVCRVTFHRLIYTVDYNEDFTDVLNKMLIQIEPILPENNLILQLFPELQNTSTN